MLSVKETTQYRKDFKKALKSGRDMDALGDIVSDLVEEKVLLKKNNRIQQMGAYPRVISKVNCMPRLSSALVEGMALCRASR